MNQPLEFRLIESLDHELRKRLSALLTATVNEGASIGFLAPLEEHTADTYWESVPAAGTLLLSAWLNGTLAGSAQLHLCLKENGLHRAEVCKLMVLPQFRRKGIARKLMETIHRLAAENGRTLLVLDTRAGDPSNTLYQSLGYVPAGKIPGYARSSDGQLEATVLYYKRLD
ncbi:MAG TPA: GNAT family N-acetyltransferase [Sphingobacteriaceae bacterium]